MNGKKMIVFSLMTAVFLFLVGVPVGNASIPCCKNGQLSTCPNLPNGQQYDISSCINVTPYQPGINIDHEANLNFSDQVFTTGDNCVKGRVQYRQNGSCGTSSRTCCSDGNWSDWDKTCSGSSNCTSVQCWDGNRCVDKEEVSRKCLDNISNASGGTQTRTAKCISGTGWEYGEWTGDCECSNGYAWKDNACVKEVDCSDRTYKLSNKSECCPKMPLSDSDCYTQDKYVYRFQGNVRADVNTSCNSFAMNDPGSDDEKCTRYLSPIKYGYKTVSKLSAGGCANDSCSCNKSFEGSLGYTKCSDFGYSGTLSGGVCWGSIDLYKCIKVTKGGQKIGW